MYVIQKSKFEHIFGKQSKEIFLFFLIKELKHQVLDIGR